MEELINRDMFIGSKEHHRVATCTDTRLYSRLGTDRTASYQYQK